MAPLCFFASDLHGSSERYRKLTGAIRREMPSAVFLGGDLLPHGIKTLAGMEDNSHAFIEDFLAPLFTELRQEMRDTFPRIFLIRETMMEGSRNIGFWNMRRLVSGPIFMTDSQTGKHTLFLDTPSFLLHLFA